MGRTDRAFGNQHAGPECQPPVQKPVEPFSGLRKVKYAAAVRPGAQRAVSRIGFQHGNHPGREIGLPVLFRLHVINEHGKMKIFPEARHHAAKALRVPGHLLQDPLRDPPVFFIARSQPDHKKTERLLLSDLVAFLQGRDRFLRAGQDPRHRAAHHALPAQKHGVLFFLKQTAFRLLHRPLQLVHPDRLEQIALHPKLQRLSGIAEIRIGGQDQGNGSDPLSFQLCQHGQAVHIRHADV